MKRIGFIGMGAMGSRMAARLLDAGFQLTVYNRTHNKTKTLVERGAKLAESPRTLAENAEVVISMISDDVAVKEVMEGKNGAFSGASRGTVFIDSSTITPSGTQHLAKAANEQGFEWLDAPVLGSTPAAEAGKLTFLVGGKSEILESHQDIFSAMGQRVVHIGENGAGQTAKLVHNLVCGILLEAMGEALLLGEKAGLERKQIVEIFSTGAFNSPVVQAKIPLILQDKYDAMFALGMMHKDISLALKTAQELNTNLPVLSLVKEIYAKGVSKGYEKLDCAAIMRVIREMSESHQKK